jgi:uncharacterized protein YjdB
MKLAVGVLLACALAGCTDTFSDSVAPPLVLTSIAVNNPGGALPVGRTVQLEATGRYPNGGTANLTPLVAWTSANPLIASVAEGGVALGVSPGVAEIRATHQGVTGTVGIVVVP